MKNIIFVLIVLAIPLIELNAQSSFKCGSPYDIPDHLKTLKSLAQPASSYKINIFFHVMTKSDGTGGVNSGQVSAALNIIQGDYAPYNISFYCLGTDNISNDTYYQKINFVSDNNGDGKFDDFMPNSHCNAIDIYLFPDNWAGDEGLSAGIPATALVIGGSYNSTNLCNTHAISHELGHCFGLFHTFHGSSYEPTQYSCAELVNGSNCSTCGDYCCDTPADPWTDYTCMNGCTWTGYKNPSCCGGSATDANGNYYNPNPHLYMAYTVPNCMTTHTPNQVARMFNHIANTGFLQNVICTQINGPFLLCYSSTGSYIINNLPSSDTLIWNYSSNLQLVSSQNSNPAIFKNVGGDGSGWIYATVCSSCGRISSPIYNMWCGKFQNTVVTGQAQVCPNSIYTYTAQVPGGNQSSYSYSWTYPSGWYNNGLVQNMINLQTPQYNMQYGAVRVSITNACGISGYSGITTYPGTCGNVLSVSPNPVSDDLAVTLNAQQTIEDTTTINTNDISSYTSSVSKKYSVLVTDNMGFVYINTIQFSLRIYNTCFCFKEWQLHFNGPGWN